MVKIPVTYIGMNANGNFDTEFEQLKNKFLAQYRKENPETAQAISDVRTQTATDPSTLINNAVTRVLGNCPGIPVGTAYINLSPIEKEQYRITVLHWLKQRRQVKWLAYIERFIAQRIKQVLIEEKKKSGERLYIVALPEFFFTDINDDNIHTLGGPPGSPHIPHYNKPFYFDNVANYFHINGNRKGTSLAKLTSNSNVIIFAGTIVWKNPNTVNHLTETFYNSLPVFYEGQCQFMWDKRYTSDIDGFGKPAKGPAAHVHSKWEKTPPVPTAATMRRVNESDISQLQGGTVNPYFTYSYKISGKAVHDITIGADICLDFALYAMSTMKKKAGHLWTRTKPHIHMLVAAGMPEDTGYMYASHLFLRCDKFEHMYLHKPVGRTSCYHGSWVSWGDGMVPELRGSKTYSFFDVYETTLDYYM